MTRTSRSDRPDGGEPLAVVVARLRDELDGLRRAMRNRAVIEQAKGMLVERLGLGLDDAFDHLVQLSQQTNVKVVEVAASLVGTGSPAPTAPARGASPATPSAVVPAAVETAKSRPVAVRSSDVEALQAQHQLLSSRISAARSADEIAASLRGVTTGWPVPDAVLLFGLEPDGAIGLLGADGLSPEGRSQWTRVPPVAEIPSFVVIRTGAPVWTSGEEQTLGRYPAMRDAPTRILSTAVVPLVRDGRVVGTLSQWWTDAIEIDEEMRRYLAALAEPCARRLATLTGTAVPPTAVDQAEWLPLVLENLLEPVAVLAPVWSSSREIEDFVVEYANDAAERLITSEHEDPTLLMLAPEVGSSVLLPAFTEVLTSGDAATLDKVEFADRKCVLTVHAARLWDRLLVTGRQQQASDAIRHAKVALTTQRTRLANERRTVEALRRAVVPEGPEIAMTDALTVRGLCRPAKKPDASGGRWFDVFPVRDGSAILTLGVTATTGLDGAAVAGRLRTALRAYALQSMAPGQMLTALNALVYRFEPEQTASVVVGRFDGNSHHLCWSAAGQTPPVLYRHDGEVSVQSGPLGLPLGAAGEFVYAETEVATEIGDRLVLYSDTLLRRGDRPYAEALDALLRAPDQTGLDDVAALLDHLTERLGPAEEDVCVLTARVTR